MIRRPASESVRASRDAGRHSRRGAAIVLICAALFILIAMAMFSVDVAYMHLTRTELRAATDAAAKAGVDALSQYQNKKDAIRRAIEVASMNQVAGRPLRITKKDIEFGKSEYQPDGSWKFIPNGEPFSAMRVKGSMSESNANGSVKLFFAGAFGLADFMPDQVATASHLDQEICLVLDRSHSMCFDMSGVDWSYPDGGSKKGEYTKPPHPTKSRWAALRRAVDAFFEAAKETAPLPRVGLVTWGSAITDPSGVFEAVSFESPLATDYKAIKKVLKGRSDKTMLGGTNMAAGIDGGTAVLTGSDVRPLTVKTMILVTDGQWNEGRSPIDAARDAKARGLVIHVVSLLPGADQPDLDLIASLTGGRHYHADDEAALVAAFEELARTIPVVLTE